MGTGLESGSGRFFFLLLGNSIKENVLLHGFTWEKDKTFSWSVPQHKIHPWKWSLSSWKADPQLVRLEGEWGGKCLQRQAHLHYITATLQLWRGATETFNCFSSSSPKQWSVSCCRFSLSTTDDWQKEIIRADRNYKFIIYLLLCFWMK